MHKGHKKDFSGSKGKPQKKPSCAFCASCGSLLLSVLVPYHTISSVALWVLRVLCVRLTRVETATKRPGWCIRAMLVYGKPKTEDRTTSRRPRHPCPPDLPAENPSVPDCSCPLSGWPGRPSSLPIPGPSRCRPYRVRLPAERSSRRLRIRPLCRSLRALFAVRHGSHRATRPIPHRATR